MCVQVISKASLLKPQTRAKLDSEISILQAVVHPRIVKYVEHFEDDKNIYILQECCSKWPQLHTHSHCTHMLLLLLLLLPLRQRMAEPHPT